MGLDAETEWVIDYVATSSSEEAGALDMGSDNMVDDTMATGDIEDVDETENADITKAIEDLSTDAGDSIGGDSSVDGSDDSSSGTSFWTYVMWIGGALLVLALVGGL